MVRLLACIVLMVVAAAFQASSASADDVGPPAPAAPSQALPLNFLLPDHGLNADIGLGVTNHPTFVGSSAKTTELVPVLEIQYGRDFHVSLVDGASYTPIHFGPITVGAVVEFKQAFSSPRLARGLRNANNWDGGVLGRINTGIGVFEGHLHHSLDGDDTRSADLTYDAAFQQTRRLAFAFELRAAWSNEAFVIPGSKSRAVPQPGLVDRATDFYSAGGQVAVIYEIRDHWFLAGVVSKDEIVEAQRKAIRLSTRSVPVVSIAITRRLNFF